MSPSRLGGRSVTSGTWPVIGDAMGENQAARPGTWRARLEEARTRRSAAFVLRGARGGGRTTALRRLHDAADGWLRLHADGSGLERDLPYATVSVLLHRLAAAVPELRDEIDRVESRLFAPPDVDRSVMLSDLLQLLQSAAEASPVLVTVDDVADGDLRSLETLVFLARRLDRAGICIALTAEPGAAAMLADAGLEIIDLPAAEPDLIAFLVRERLGVAGPPEVCETIANLADGDLRLAREVVAALSDEQLAGVDALPVPLPANDPAAGRILAQLPPRTRDALAVVAFARVASSRVLGEALRTCDLDLDDLLPAEEQRVVALDAGRVSFVSARLRSAAVRRVVPAERRRMHAALAAAIASTAPSERDAWVHHLAAAAVVAGDELVDLFLEVATRAADGGRPLDAARAAADAARWSASGDPQGAALLTAASHARAGGASTWTGRLLDAALRAGVGPELRARIQQERARMDASGGAPGAALHVLLDASARIEPVDRELAAELSLSGAVAAFASWAVDRGRAAAARARTLARRGSLTQSHASMWCAAFALMAGDIDAGLRGLHRHQETPQVQVSEGSVLARSAAAYGSMLAEDLQGARGSLASLVAELDAVGAVGWLAVPLVTLAEVEYRRGWWDAATQHAERASVVAASSGQDVVAGRAHALLARLAAHRGHDPVWADQVSRARALAVTTGSEAILALVEVAEGLGWMVAADHHRAVLHLSEARRLAQDAGVRSSAVLWCAGDHLRVLIAAGHREQAADLLADLEAERAGGGGAWLDGVVFRAATELQPSAVSVSELSRVADALATVPMPFERAKVLMALVSHHVQRGDGGAAWTALQDLRPALEPLGARAWNAYVATLEEQISRLLEADAAPVHSLTAQELRVARRVAQGGSNREVALALSLSEKTVEYHLHKVYAKLSLPSRASLIRLGVASPFPDPDA